MKYSWGVVNANKHVCPSDTTRSASAPSRLSEAPDLLALLRCHRSPGLACPTTQHPSKRGRHLPSPPPNLAGIQQSGTLRRRNLQSLHCQRRAMEGWVPLTRTHECIQPLLKRAEIQEPQECYSWGHCQHPQQPEPHLDTQTLHGWQCLHGHGVQSQPNWGGPLSGSQWVHVPIHVSVHRHAQSLDVLKNVGGDQLSLSEQRCASEPSHWDVGGASCTNLVKIWGVRDRPNGRTANWKTHFWKANWSYFLWSGWMGTSKSPFSSMEVNHSPGGIA